MYPIGTLLEFQHAASYFQSQLQSQSQVKPESPSASLRPTQQSVCACAADIHTIVCTQSVHTILDNLTCTVQYSLQPITQHTQPALHNTHRIPSSVFPSLDTDTYPYAHYDNISPSQRYINRASMDHMHTHSHRAHSCILQPLPKLHHISVLRSP